MARRGASLGTSVLDLDVDESKLSSGLAAGEKKAQGFLSRLVAGVKNLGSSLKGGIAQGLGIGAGLTALQAVGSAVRGVTSYMGDALQAASALNESQSKVAVVFGESAADIEKWASRSATAFGQSTQQALEAVGTYGNLFQAFGVGREESAKMSKALVELAADLASFNNTSVDDALVALRAGLSGETEPLRRYGIAISDARMRTQLATMGFKSLGATLTPLQKSTAAYALIMQDSSLAQGDFARTADGAANAGRTIEAQMADLSAQIGEALLPVMTELAKFARDNLIPAISDLTQKIKDAKPLWDALGVAIGLVLKTAGDSEAARDLGARLAQQYGVGITAIEGQTAAAVAGAISKMAITLRDAEPIVQAATKSGITDAMHKEMREAREKAVAEARAIPGDISRALVAGQQDVESGMQTLIDLMSDKWTDASRIAYYKGVLSSQELANGLKSGDADVRDEANRLKATAEYQLKLLESGAADAAVDAGTTFAEQLRLQDVAARDAASAMLIRAKGVLQDTSWAATGGAAIATSWADALAARLNNDRWKVAQALYGYKLMLIGTSPPPKGPLHTIDQGAFAIGQVWTENLAKGIRSDLGAVTKALPTLGASVAVPRIPMPSMPGLADLSLPGGVSGTTLAGLGSAGGTTIENHWHLSVQGVPYDFESRDDFISALDDLSAFGGDGRIGR